MRILYETSAIIKNATDKTPLPDTVFTELPDSLTLHAQQTDSVFGKNVYSYEYRIGADFMSFKQENLTSMSYGLLTAVDKNKFNTILAVVDAGDDYLVYVTAFAKTASIPGMGDSIGASFANRAVAILNWFNRIN